MVLNVLIKMKTRIYAAPAVKGLKKPTCECISLTLRVRGATLVDRILTTKFDPRIIRVNIFLLTVDP